MAVIWSRNDGIEWAPREVPSEGLSLFSIVEPEPVESPIGRAPELRPKTGPRPAWILLAPAGDDVTVNGESVTTGIRTLRDRDAIQLDDRGPVFFSSERLARVTPCPITDRAIYCQRCKTKIEIDSLAVECPSCDAWHHQTDALPCWLYAETCALCSQPTDFDSDFRWRPEDL